MLALPGCHALVLAAGAGRRFGGGKLTHPWRDRPLVAWSVEAALAQPVERVTVVLGCDADRVEAALAPWRGDRLALVRSVGWAEGMGRSLADGVASLPGGWAALLVLLGDMPAAPVHLGTAFLLAVLGGAPAVLPSLQGRDGHPVALGRALWDRHGPTAGDAGLRHALEAEPGVLRLPCRAPGVCLDVDRPAGLDRLHEAFPEGRSALVAVLPHPPTCQRGSHDHP